MVGGYLWVPPIFGNLQMFDDFWENLKFSAVVGCMIYERITNMHLLASCWHSHSQLLHFRSTSQITFIEATNPIPTHDHLDISTREPLL